MSCDSFPPPRGPVVVIGAGTMGHGIAHVSAAAGFCYSFPLGHAGRKAVVARVTTPRGRGSISFEAWRLPDPDVGRNDEPVASLRLPSIGTPKDALLERYPRCAEEWDDERSSCRFHGAVFSAVSAFYSACLGWKARHVGRKSHPRRRSHHVACS